MLQRRFNNGPQVPDCEQSAWMRGLSQVKPAHHEGKVALA